MPAAVADAAARLAALLTGEASSLSDPAGAPGSALEFEAPEQITPRPLARSAPFPDVWAVDGGQALVADARCLAVVVTRAATVRYQRGECVVEHEGDLRATLLGGEPERAAAVAELTRLGLGPARPDAAVDLNLLRDAAEWHAVAECVSTTDSGGAVLVDGDLQPDWRIASTFLAALLEQAQSRGVTLVGVTKHSSLARGGAPLLGWLEQQAAAALGERALWWAPVARTRPDVGEGIQVVAARLDPDARFAFRIDLPAAADPEAALGSLAGLCDDAAFPGYPYPLSVADRLAACPPWLRDEVRFELDDHLHAAGVPLDVRERAFADRHGLMERS